MMTVSTVYVTCMILVHFRILSVFVVVTVRFGSPNYTFIENEINTFAVLQIDRTILKDLSVSIFGGKPVSTAKLNGMIMHDY